MNQDRCSRCQKDGHATRGCEKPWPFWDKQECDFCGKDENHDSFTCTKNDNLPLCKTCGHGGHYHTACKLKDKTDANLQQYTESRYLIAMGRPENAPWTPVTNTGQSSVATGSSGTRRPNQPTNPISGSLPTRPSGNASGIEVGNSSQASSSNTQGQQNATDPTERRETTLQIRTSNIKRPTLSVEDQEKLKWASEKFDEVPYSQNVTRDLHIVTNFLKVSFRPGNYTLHKYRIQLGRIDNRAVTKAEVKRALIKKLLHIQRPPIVPFASDYLEFVISVGPLYPEFTSTALCAYDVPHLRSAPAGQQPIQMDTIFWFDGRFEKDKLLNYFEYSSNVPASAMVGYLPDQEVRNLNVLSWNHISDDRTFIGGRSGKKFYPGLFRDSRPLGAGTTYVVNRGIFSSMRPGRESLLLNINPTTTAFFPSIILQDWINARWPGAQHLPMPHGIELRELINLRVTFAGHLADTNGKRKPWIIFGFSLNPPSFRPKVNGIEQPRTTVPNYMRSTYPNLNIGQTCWVNCGNNANHRWFPATQCTLVEWQVVKGPIAQTFTADMLILAQTHADQNKREAIAASELLGAVPPPNFHYPPGTIRHSSLRAPGNPDASWPAFCATYGLDLSWNLLRISARYLRQPDLIFRQRNEHIYRFQLSGRRDGSKASWNLQNLIFVIRPTAAFRLCFILVGLPADLVINALPAALNQYLNNNALMSTNGILRSGADVRADRGAFAGNLDTAYDAMVRDLQPQERALIIAILPSKYATTYAHLKWWGDCRRGVPTICVTRLALGNNFRTGRFGDSFLGNLSMKVNFKLRGTNHGLADNYDWYGAKAHTMIVGADVTHPGKTTNPTMPSMAGVVATRDSRSAHYLGSARLQDKNNEFIVGLDSMIEERVMVYFATQRRLPEHILFYRDGVSESQFGMVKDRELPLIKQGCNRAGSTCGAGANWCPRITLLVVGKRHHARFYPQSPTPARTAGANLYSGLVVDSDVTSPWKADFYLQSHDSFLGTARTAHYIVIENESGYAMNEIQELTNKLCYTGSRATKALSVCTPARYADILCDRLRCYMKDVLAIGAPNQGQPPLTLAQYRLEARSWGANAGLVNQGLGGAGAPNTPPRLNPWHRNLDDVMFYL